MKKRLKKDTHNYVGKNILSLRTKMGWSQEHIANKLGISIAAFSKIETGVTNTRLSRIRQIARVFDLNAMDLFAKEIEKVQPASKLTAAQTKIAECDAEIVFLKNRVILLYEELRNVKLLA